MMSEKKKVALVTGASRGIGRVIALSLAKQGAYVIGTATTEKGAEAISARFKDAGQAGEGKLLNVADPESVTALLADIKKQHAAPSILVNNAGITRDNLMLRMSDEQWFSVLTTCLTGSFYMTRACLRDMVKARWGRIINISSIVGTIGNAGQANYAAAKGGINAFSKALSKEVAARGITVNAVAPGFIKTEMTDVLSEEQKEKLLPLIPAGRIGECDEIAAMVTFLASDAASYITGQILHVDGGMQ